MLQNCLRFLRRIRFCRSPHGLVPGTIVFFPLTRTRLPCGLAGIVEVVRGPVDDPADLSGAEAAVGALPGCGLSALGGDPAPYAGGDESIGAIEALVTELRRAGQFPLLYRDETLRERVSAIAAGIEAFVAEEGRILDAGESLPTLDVQEVVNRRLVRLRDASWAFTHEILANVERVGGLLGDEREPSDKLLRELRKANLILNSVDRLEIRGRDSAGILFQVHFPSPEGLDAVLADHVEDVERRTSLADLPDGAVSVSDDGRTATIVFKVAAEVGSLGDNVAYLRSRVSADALLRALLDSGESQALVMAHTRWASNGIINVANCHPLDNDCADEDRPPGLEAGHQLADRVPRVHVALNGDIDNYLELKQRFEEETGRACSERITTDAKVIALWIDRYLRQGDDLGTAFRRAVRDFEGSAAILMASDLEPGRLYLSLKGSGQSLYVGLAAGGHVVGSEIYGLVEETPRFLKLEGEKPRVAGDAGSLGQIYVLDRDAPGREGITACHHDGHAIALTDDDVRVAEITTRDVDRGDYPHYFLKEVAQASGSVTKTLRGKFATDGACLMGPETIPDRLRDTLRDGGLRDIFVVGQGTASVAAMAVGAFLDRALRDAHIRVEAMKASELSGFRLEHDMSDTLVIAVTQSGATADTNRAVDLARERGAHTLAIVNRRNSDITFKTAGVLYTSDGRDVEMSVASTKAFYSQVVAGAVLGLALGEAAGTLTRAQVADELAELRRLPDLLDEVYELSELIGEVATRHAPSRRYWTVVGSGPNRIAAEEVRIKLSELCYKSISADSVEDKKHIDLSSESMILVLAAGHDDAVQADLAKDVAIFKAHRAIPIVITTRGEGRFHAYAADVIEVPPSTPLLSMITCTMAGHLFGYHAARAIDEGGRFLGRVRALVVESLDRPDLAPLGDLARYQRQFQERLRGARYASALESHTATDLTLLLKYAAGELPPASFAEEFGRAPRAAEIHATLLERLVEAVDQTLRPIDAIKHQAKIVTVGTSRIAERPTGVLFDALAGAEVPISAISFPDRMRLRQVQPAVRSVTGLTKYVLEGSPEDPDARIRVTLRTGSAAGMTSRAEQGAPLKGTKRSVAGDRRVLLCVGTKDQRRIAIVPLVDQRFHVTALALLHIEFAADLSAAAKREALGDRYERVVNGVTEADVPWTDALLEPISPEDLLTQTPAEIADRIVKAAD